MSFTYTPPFPTVVANGNSTYVRQFQHVDWVDSQDLIQAADTPTELGVNSRFHAIEAEFDAVKADLVNAYVVIAELRRELALALAQIASVITVKSKEGKDTKEKDTKEGKEKDTKEGKEGKEGKETKETKEHKDGKESKESKEGKDGKEAGFAEKLNDKPGSGPYQSLPDAQAFDVSEPSVGRAFIRPDERPRIGARLLDEPSA